MTTPNQPSSADPRKDSLIEYPSRFPIKVIELRDSRAGNYLGVTITVTATSREQLDDLYRALTSHPMVKVVL